MMMCSLLFCLSGTGCRLASADPTTAFVGDSITQGWSYPAANFGVFGNTTQQILDRLPDELPGHGYKSMVLLAGTNDVLQRVDPAVTIANIEKLAEIGLANGARPVLCEVPPIFRGGSQQEKQTNHDRVVDLNNRIVALAARRQWIVVDYYDPLANHPDYFADGVHLRRRGYVEMELAYLKAIAGS
jgi:lysophospholipase L1-like esterase